jgi:predicted RNase H-like HicB family nuclease
MCAFAVDAARPRSLSIAAAISLLERSAQSSGISSGVSEGSGFVSRSYRVVIERDETGAWIARVAGVRGCHTYGRSLDEVRRRIREALSLWVDDSEAAQLLEEIHLPREARHAIRRSSAARAEAEREREKAQAATVAAAELLVDRFGLGLRDAGELLGLSHQRIQQLVS